MLKNNKIYLLSLIIALVVVNIISAFFIVSNGSSVNALEKEKRITLNENQEMRDELVENSSLTSLTSKAFAFGYNKAETKIYVTNLETAVASAK